MMVRREYYSFLRIQANYRPIFLMLSCTQGNINARLTIHNTTPYPPIIYHKLRYIEVCMLVLCIFSYTFRQMPVLNLVREVAHHPPSEEAGRYCQALINTLQYGIYLCYQIFPYYIVLLLQSPSYSQKLHPFIYFLFQHQQ